jgi:hypothetical protein
LSKSRRRSGWKPPPIEVGDRVKHLVMDAFGTVVKLNGTTATVIIGGKDVVVDVKGVSYFPSLKKINQQKRLIDKSRKVKSLRAALGLPRFVGVKDKCLLKEPK